MHLTLLEICLLVLVVSSSTEYTSHPKHHHSKHSLPSCTNCTLQSQLRLQGIKKQILDVLGLTEPPNVHLNEEERKRILSSPEFRQSPQNQERNLLGLHIYATDVYRSSHPTASFRFSESTMRRPVVSAVLGVHLRQPPIVSSEETSSEENKTPDTILVKVFERSIDGKLGDVIAVHRFPVPTSEETDHILITLQPQDVERWWSEDANDFVGLFIDAQYAGQNLAVHPQDEESSLKKIVLALKLGSVPNRRKRQAQCTAGQKEEGCCLYDLYIDFQQLQWDFVIAPQRYNAFVCSGDCKLATSTNAKGAHGLMANKGIDRSGIVGGTCCHPSEYDSLDMIYVSSTKEIISATIPGMVASKCSCT